MADTTLPAGNPFVIKRRVLALAEQVTWDSTPEELARLGGELAALGSSVPEVLLGELQGALDRPGGDSARLVALLAHLPREGVVESCYRHLAAAAEPRGRFAALTVLGGLLGDAIDMARVAPYFPDLEGLQQHLGDFMLDAFLDPDHAHADFAAEFEEMSVELRAFTLQNLLAGRRPEALELVACVLGLLDADQCVLVAEALADRGDPIADHLLNLLLLDEQFKVVTAARRTVERRRARGDPPHVLPVEEWRAAPAAECEVLHAPGPPERFAFWLARGAGEDEVAGLAVVDCWGPGLQAAQVFEAAELRDARQGWFRSAADWNARPDRYRIDFAVSVLAAARAHRAAQGLPPVPEWRLLRWLLPDEADAAPAPVAFGAPCTECGRRVRAVSLGFRGVYDPPRVLCEQCGRGRKQCDGCGRRFRSRRGEARLAPGERPASVRLLCAECATSGDDPPAPGAEDQSAL